MDPNNEDDLSSLDRGDNLETETKTDERPRDEQGRFVSPDAEKTAEEPADETAEETAEDATGEEGEEEGDKQNFAIRLNKAKAQRDKAREENAALAAEMAALKARLEALEKPAAQQEPQEDPLAKLNSELDALYEKVENARADGDTKLAAQLQRQIDAANRELVKAEAVNTTTQKLTVQQVNQRYDAMVDHLEATVDVLNPKSENFDPALTKELDELSRAYEARGMNPLQALRKATTILLREDPFAPQSEKAQEPKKEAPKPALKKTDVAKAVETAGKQPPDSSTRGVNKDSSKLDVAALSDEELDKLPASKRAQLRGDFL